jgi:hypothetical protein
VSWVCDDTTELVSGGWLASAYAGHGILAEDIPAAGEHGASVLYDQIALPGDAGKELRALLLSTPSGMTSWFQDEDGSVEAEAPDGSYTYSIQVYVDGVALGTPKTVTLTFGATGGSAAVAITGTAGALSAVAASPAAVSLGMTGAAGTLEALAESAVLAALAQQGGAGSMSLVAGSAGTAVAVSITGTAGTLAAVAGSAPLVTMAVQGGAGTLSALAGGVYSFVMPDPERLMREPAELRFVTEPAETRFILR